MNFLDIDECSSSPCKNGASCIDEVDMYACQCLAGYTGDQCETSTHLFFRKCVLVKEKIIILDIDECSSSPCENGGTCIDEIDYFTCQCMAGYTGDQCETSECVRRWICGFNFFV